jgi:predicted DNA-binding ribbon-helix-helix protein
MGKFRSQPKGRLQFKNGGRKTTARLEKPFLMGLKEAAVGRNMSSTGLVREIAKQRPVNLSSAVRVFVLEFYRNQIKQHQREDKAADVEDFEQPDARIMLRQGARVVRDTGQRSC